MGEVILHFVGGKMELKIDENKILHINEERILLKLPKSTTDVKESIKAICIPMDNIETMEFPDKSTVKRLRRRFPDYFKNIK